MSPKIFEPFYRMQRLLNLNRGYVQSICHKQAPEHKWVDINTYNVDPYSMLQQKSATPYCSVIAQYLLRPTRNMNSGVVATKEDFYTHLRLLSLHGEWNVSSYPRGQLNVTWAPYRSKNRRQTNWILFFTEKYHGFVTLVSIIPTGLTLPVGKSSIDWELCYNTDNK